MITTILVAILAVVLFILFLCIILVGITNGDTMLSFVGVIAAVLLCFGIASYIQSDTVTKPEVTKTVETESTNVETDKAVEELIASFKGEDSVESEKNSENSEETEGVGMGTIIIIVFIVFSPALLFILLDLIDGITDFTVDLIEICFSKKNKETKTEKFVRETNENSEDNPFIKKIPTPKQKKGINIDKLAEKDSKIAYIVWAVKFLNDQGKENYTRKLESYYIPEIVQAYEQYQKVKSFNVKEMTTEAKKHYEKIVDLSCRVARAEVKKAAGEIVMDMDCNADVCEDIYKKDGYTSMKEELSDIPKEEKPKKKQEKTLHAKSISRDTMIIWDSDFVTGDDMDKPKW